MTASGICHTDLLIRDGSFPTPMPVVLGHEGAGVVEEVGAAMTRVSVGDRIALSDASCGGCHSCASGRPFCGLIGAPPVGTEEALDVNGLLSTGRTVRGLVEGHSVPQNFIPQLIDLWRDGRLPVDRLIRAYDFDQINEAADAALAGDVVKPVLRMPY
jgi:Zn-dependent alcohol dehydrogenase